MPPETGRAHRSSWFATQRKDMWWLQPFAIAVGFTAFIIYATWAGLQGVHYEYLAEGRNYVSPFYSPCVTDLCHHGPLAGAIPNPVIFGWAVSPAVFILWAPVGFRATCYYYRKAYYRAYFQSPSGCAVEAKPRDYKGESAFPFILQNLHRYVLPFALLLIVFLTYDAVLSFFFTAADGGMEFGIGVGSLVLTANAVLLAGYTFGCHSLRHIVGGGKDCWTCPVGPNQEKIKEGNKMWKIVTWFNQRHQAWAWTSLFMVGFADLYVRLVSMGVWTDVRLI